MATRASSVFDPPAVAWRRISDPACPDYKVDFEYCLLGYDLELGRLDMLLRYGPGYSHCRRHRHVASTVTLVLKGEQHLRETQPDGSIKEVRRTKGDYAIAPADALPHDENGGPGGGTILLSMVAPDGILFEYFDSQAGTSWTVSVAEYVESWTTGQAYGTAPATERQDAV